VNVNAGVKMHQIGQFENEARWGLWERLPARLRREEHPETAEEHVFCFLVEENPDEEDAFPNRPVCRSFGTALRVSASGSSKVPVSIISTPSRTFRMASEPK
jgi:hypothetical protein